MNGKVFGVDIPQQSTKRVELMPRLQGWAPLIDPRDDLGRDCIAPGALR